MNPLYEYIYIPVAVLCAALLWARSKRAKHYGALPPSPKSDPLVGNLRIMMNVLDDAKTYRDWGLELGSDIISVTVPGQVIIILNSREQYCGTAPETVSHFLLQCPAHAEARHHFIGPLGRESRVLDVLFSAPDYLPRLLSFVSATGRFS
ncbi:hypothetical protein RSOLAG22IIIB_11402 [Rhizoctonia solani]|uniref:Cytochrome P450 n=1 Tax=Rhizoctonia solani TaxID=456999 RepID=A0A0K6G876_9AGAM|nr:hypothetical protein RSOLAG22IIIB_11402 [Rhizoctonia solani]